MNMYSHGVDPKLDFSDMPAIAAVYEECTRMRVYERAPYAGALVFAAFSGSHQDAIAKGMKWREKNGRHRWTVPYLPIDPADVNRTYDADVIRVNSQSGKGGIGYLLETTYGYVLPSKMREDLSYACKAVSDEEHRELKVEDILTVFKDRYFAAEGPVSVCDINFSKTEGRVSGEIVFEKHGVKTTIKATGNGSIDVISNALKSYTGAVYTLEEYSEHSMRGNGSQSVAVAYIGINIGSEKHVWGAGMNTDITRAGADALVNAYNNSLKKEK